MTDPLSLLSLMENLCAARTETFLPLDDDLPHCPSVDDDILDPFDDDDP